MRIREATHSDLDFLVEAVVEAERSGTGTSFYENVFQFSDAEFRSFITQLLRARVEDSELDPSRYLIAATNGTPHGAIAAWVERDGEAGSGFRKAKAMSEIVGMERWLEAQEIVRNLRLPDLGRKAGTLQLDGLYVKPDVRSRGVATALINTAIFNAAKLEERPSRIQSLVLSDNTASRKAFENAGFLMVGELLIDDAKVRQYLPGTGRSLWERSC